MKASIYESITSQIVQAIEDGAGEYRMPWHRGGASITTPINGTTGRAYRGINILTLWATAQARGFASGNWAAYQQWSEHGAQVRKGEKSASVVFYKQLGEREDDQGDDGRRAAFVARGYNVFNGEQVDGFTPADVPELPESERVANAEALSPSLGPPLSAGSLALPASRAPTTRPISRRGCAS